MPYLEAEKKPLDSASKQKKIYTMFVSLYPTSLLVKKDS